MDNWEIYEEKRNVNMNKISVIIPVYNGEKYLDAMLDSVCNSDYEDLEIIIVDDGSTDSSVDIYQKRMKEDDRIIALHKENGGIVSARNLGLENATGDYIHFCDQDDIVDRRFYRRMMERIKADKSDVAICSCGRLVNDKKIDYEKIKLDQVVEKKDIPQFILEPLLFMDIQTVEVLCPVKGLWGYLVSRDVIRQGNIRFRRFIDFDDDFCYEIDVVKNSNYISLIKDTMYYWRYNLASEMHRKKYFPDRIHREMEYTNFIISVAQEFHIEKEKIELFLKYKQCQWMLIMIENESNRLNRDKFKVKKKRIHDFMNSENGIEAKKQYHNFELGIRPKLVFPILEKNMLMTALVVNTVLNRISDISWVKRIRLR